MEDGGEAIAGEEPSEEELRQAIEDQLRNARVEELLVQSVVSLVNLSARRLGIEEERDLAQAKLGIDAVRALVDLLPADLGEQVRQALSQLQLQFVQLSGDGGGEGTEPEDGAPSSGDAGASGDAQGQPGPAGPRQGGSGLWTPPGSV